MRFELLFRDFGSGWQPICLRIGRFCRTGFRRSIVFAGLDFIARRPEWIAPFARALSKYQFQVFVIGPVFEGCGDNSFCLGFLSPFEGAQTAEQFDLPGGPRVVTRDFVKDPLGLFVVAVP